MMRILLIIVIAAGYTAYHYWGTGHELKVDSASQYVQQTIAEGGDRLIRQAFENQARHLQVEASGTVVKVLDDDTTPPRHQRFILKLENGITLLMTHNIDLAERVADLKAGDTVGFYGEYEWNNKGGVVHWTHHDPQGAHVAGWLRHNGKTYQ